MSHRDRAIATDFASLGVSSVKGSLPRPASSLCLCRNRAICPRSTAVSNRSIDTGIDLPKLLEAARLAERIIGRRLEGKLMHSGLPRAQGAEVEA